MSGLLGTSSLLDALLKGSDSSGPSPGVIPIDSLQQQSVAVDQIVDIVMNNTTDQYTELWLTSLLLLHCTSGEGLEREDRSGKRKR